MDIFDEVRRLFKIKEPKGYPPEKVLAVKRHIGGLPPVLERFFLELALSGEFKDNCDRFYMADSCYLYTYYYYYTFFSENQGVWSAGIRERDLKKADPPVFVFSDDESKSRKTADSTTEFLTAALLYEASMGLEFTPDAVYWLEERDYARFEALFKKRSEHLKSWFKYPITLHSDSRDAMISLHHVKDHYEVRYSANNQQEFERLQLMLKDIVTEL